MVCKNVPSRCKQPSLASWTVIIPTKKIDLQLQNVIPSEKEGCVLLEDSDCSPAVEFLIVGRDWDSPQCSSAKDGFYT
jgi:hypothetical protein